MAELALWIVLLVALAASSSYAHSPLECTTRAILTETKLELVLTVGMDAGARLLKDAPAEAFHNRPVGPGVTLPAEFARRLFDLAFEGRALNSVRILCRTDGLEFNLTVEYDRPAKGALTVQPIYINRLPANLKSLFILTDEVGNILSGHQITSDASFELALPTPAPLREFGSVAQVSSEMAVPLTPALSQRERENHSAPQGLNSAIETSASLVPPLLGERDGVRGTAICTSPTALATTSAPDRWLGIGISFAVLLLIAIVTLGKRTRATTLPLLILVIPSLARAQRQAEPLGRGVVVIHPSASQAYVGWRLLATDPASIAFNLYRSANGAAPTLLNPQPLTSTTDFMDTNANFSVSNSWFVRPVINGFEQLPSAAAGLAANPPVRQYLSWPLQPVSGGANPPYDVKFCWVGDLDGDGEYDYVADRLSLTADVPQYLQAYKRDGTLLWQMNMGYNSTNQYSIEPGASAISIGDKDNVTVYDLDGDGRAEVIVRTARGVVLPDGTTITGPNDTTQYLSILDGLTGHELARATIPNPWPADGPLNGHCGIMYCDGVRPSVIFEGENRIGSGAFQRLTTAWDFRNGALTLRWSWTPPPNSNYSWGHQIRIADVNHDGIDDLIEVGSAKNGRDGTPLYDTELQHGDRFHVMDIDPDHPGLETFAIQQDNPTLLATALFQSGDGKLLKKWYSSGIVDVGRGIALDMDPTHRGCEFYSTQPGIFDARGNQIWANTIWPPEGLWWDADLSREFVDGAGSGALSPVVNKFDPVSGTSGRLYTIYNDNGGVHQAYGGRPAFWGDILGDWREELVLVANDYSELRVYTTKIPATNRLYCLMQNQQYRMQCTCKGYYQASYVDYYLGQDMPPPPPPPISDARLVWRGGGANQWDSSTASWFTNNLWIANTTPVAFTPGDTVLFDMTGSNQSAVTLVGSLTPGDVRIHSPKDYVFNGDGELAGAMSLTKAGAGKVVFNGTNTYTGTTLIAEGPFIVNGSLPSSAVTVSGGVWLDGRLGGNGVIGAAVSVREGGGVSPGGGTNSPGVLTINNGVTLAGRTLNDFDLSDDPTGTIKTNDLLVVSGNLTLQGTNSFVIRRLNGTLPPGSIYPLINYSGALNGSLNNLVVAGLSGIPVTLTNPPGQIALLVKDYRPPATITWTGGSGGNAWDLLQTTNWLNASVKEQFAPLDNVRFDSTGTSNLSVNLSGDLNASSVLVDSSANYTLGGGGGIIGPCSLTKSNSGTLTISTLNNSFTGRTLIAGGTLSVPELDAVGFPSPLGSPSAGSTNLVMSGNSTLRITGESYTDRGMTLNTGTNSLEVFNAADQVTIAGQITGNGLLQKLGPGILALNVSNNFSGGTIIKAGSIALGSVAGNQAGVGTGPVTLDNGSLSMIDIQASETCPWALSVPTNSTGRLDCDGRCTLTGALTGGGTFNVWVPYVRTDFNGNWSAFTGRLNVITDSDGGDFRCNNSAGYPNAKINLATLTTLQNRVSGTPTISIGELSGAAGSFVSAPGGNSGIAVNWRVGGLNTSVTLSGNIVDSVGIIKMGTGTWTLSGTNSYSGQTIVSNGTVVLTGPAAISNSSTINLAAGTLLNVSGLAGGGMTLGSSKTISGNGAVKGNFTVGAGARLAPGNSIGALTFSNALILSATCTSTFEISKSPLTNDIARVIGALTCGGTLTVTNISASPLALNDSFRLFIAGSYGGAFSGFNLPPIPSGLAWDVTGANTNGTIKVVTASRPRLGQLTFIGSNLNLTGSSGNPFWTYYVLTSTNAALPLNQWTRLATNQFDSNGNFTFTNAIVPGIPSRYYVLQLP